MIKKRFLFLKPGSSLTFGNINLGESRGISFHLVIEGQNLYNQKIKMPVDNFTTKFRVTVSGTFLSFDENNVKKLLLAGSKIPDESLHIVDSLKIYGKTLPNESEIVLYFPFAKLISASEVSLGGKQESALSVEFEVIYDESLSGLGSITIT